MAYKSESDTGKCSNIEHDTEDGSANDCKCLLTPLDEISFNGTIEHVVIPRHS